MRKLMRETIKIIRDNGGSDVIVSQGSRHTRIHFTCHDGRRRMLLIPQGHAKSHIAIGIRSRVRRLTKLELAGVVVGRADADASVLLMRPASSVRKPAAT
ncbi:hypothetical protein ACVMGC_004812 [Bradyrhizobium barranii subsp. barranii]|uniref:hypothetical protein n=1 Tax=Bradyrhizobium liaoningense TaxID=43992 RepID=UPI001BAB7AD7|nr:hypothetical protein [Bradyrhizobium liaoningense]MBR0879148.1 hypothetical protein [Bradyrhizobium liaoningense]